MKNLALRNVDLSAFKSLSSVTGGTLFTAGTVGAAPATLAGGAKDENDCRVTFKAFAQKYPEAFQRAQAIVLGSKAKYAKWWW
uniref:Uncharacterized protein n=1 Tax=Carcinus maenas virus 1 TaxID=2704945 RepID=A0A6G9HDA2_9VIRU|nr:hypothetical protein [Carcinus maenas virus 1]